MNATKILALTVQVNFRKVMVPVRAIALVFRTLAFRCRIGTFRFCAEVVLSVDDFQSRMSAAGRIRAAIILNGFVCTMVQVCFFDITNSF